MSYFDYGPWNTFQNEVRAAEEDLGRPKRVWYRGVSDSDYSLIPSLIRKRNGVDRERELFERYKTLASTVHPHRPSDWQFLFDMQHYNVPTRLLDWTEVMGIAIFFALLGNRSDTDAAVYVLDPVALNRESSRVDVPLVYEEDDFDYKTIYWDHRPVPPVHPIAIEAPAQNTRIVAQRGKFTIHGTDRRGLENQFPNVVRKVTLDRYVREGARDYLRTSGINEFSVFPDPAGLAPFLAELVGIT